LLAQPGVELAALELVPLGRAAAGSSAPVLDARAKREYRARLLDLRADLDDARAAADLGRVGRLEAEIDLVASELAHALGLGGRDRLLGSDGERARVNVTRTLRRAVDAIAAVVPDLGAHLDVSVRTGRFCSYAPEPRAALDWDVAS
jgi:hypothetical protein